MSYGLFGVCVVRFVCVVKVVCAIWVVSVVNIT